MDFNFVKQMQPKTEQLTILNITTELFLTKISCFNLFAESNEWGVVEKIQDWQSMAEIMGCLYKLLFVFLQNARGL